MTKRQLIDEILCLNHTAQPDFLARFADGELTEYLDHLRTARIPRLSGSTGRYEQYFRKVPTIPVEQTASQAATMTVDAVAQVDHYRSHDEPASAEESRWAPPAEEIETMEPVAMNPAAEIAEPASDEDVGYYAPVHVRETQTASDDTSDTDDATEQALRPEPSTQETAPLASSFEPVDQLEAQPWLF